MLDFHLVFLMKNIVANLISLLDVEKINEFIVKSSIKPFPAQIG